MLLFVVGVRCRTGRQAVLPLPEDVFPAQGLLIRQWLRPQNYHDFDAGVIAPRPASSCHVGSRWPHRRGMPFHSIYSESRRSDVVSPATGRLGSEPAGGGRHRCDYRPSKTDGLERALGGTERMVRFGFSRKFNCP
ncbi:hypothetical protein EVAR_54342_1 [Eumeta japonica]|uniref:Uncharacterized protein n=1 Tax=Eumeta variegata TaxID=151549 RepID=A0A4C1Y4J1_EUMVA|nr:hypothetical protein EVAR_54342_1 [Eumeta japonica]